MLITDQVATAPCTDRIQDRGENPWLKFSFGATLQRLFPL